MPAPEQHRSNGMTREDFWGFARDLAVYYGSEKLATPTHTGKEQLKAWYEQVQNLPAEPLQWISDRIKATYDIMPKNLPKLMWALWYEWRAEHPEKQAERINPDNCDCHGGAILVRYHGEWVAVRCLKCMPPLPDNFEKADIGGKHKHGVWQSTMDELKREGWEIKNAPKPKGSPREAFDLATQGKRTDEAYREVLA